MKQEDMTYFDIKLGSSAGFAEAEDFYKKFFIATIKWMKRYYNHFPGDRKEHGFMYYEQQIKTYLTLALGEISKGYLMQEQPVTRRIIPIGKRKPTAKYGRSDYWVTVKPNTYLIEVKDGYIKYSSDECDFNLEYDTDRLVDSIKQIRNTADKMNYIFSNHMYGLGLVVSPIYCKGRKGDILPSLSLEEDTKNSLSKKFRKMGANACAVWALPEQYILREEDNLSNPFQWVGMTFIGKIIKFSRSRTPSDTRTPKQ